MKTSLRVQHHDHYQDPGLDGSESTPASDTEPGGLAYLSDHLLNRANIRLEQFCQEDEHVHLHEFEDFKEHYFHHYRDDEAHFHKNPEFATQFTVNLYTKYQAMQVRHNEFMENTSKDIKAFAADEENMHWHKFPQFAEQFFKQHQVTHPEYRKEFLEHHELMDELLASFQEVQEKHENFITDVLKKVSSFAKEEHHMHIFPLKNFADHFFEDHNKAHPELRHEFEEHKELMEALEDAYDLAERKRERFLREMSRKIDEFADDDHHLHMHDPKEFRDHFFEDHNRNYPNLRKTFNLYKDLDQKLTKAFNRVERKHEVFIQDINRRIEAFGRDNHHLHLHKFEDFAKHFFEDHNNDYPNLRQEFKEHKELMHKLRQAHRECQERHEQFINKVKNSITSFANKEENQHLHSFPKFSLKFFAEHRHLDPNLEKEFLEHRELKIALKEAYDKVEERHEKELNKMRRDVDIFSKVEEHMHLHKFKDFKEAFFKEYPKHQEEFEEHRELMQYLKEKHDKLQEKHEKFIKQTKLQMRAFSRDPKNLHEHEYEDFRKAFLKANPGLKEELDEHDELEAALKKHYKFVEKAHDRFINETKKEVDKFPGKNNLKRLKKLPEFRKAFFKKYPELEEEFKEHKDLMKKLDFRFKEYDLEQTQKEEKALKAAQEKEEKSASPQEEKEKSTKDPLDIHIEKLGKTLTKNEAKTAKRRFKLLARTPSYRQLFRRISSQQEQLLPFTLVFTAVIEDRQFISLLSELQNSTYTDKEMLSMLFTNQKTSSTITRAKSRSPESWKVFRNLMRNLGVNDKKLHEKDEQNEEEILAIITESQNTSEEESPINKSHQNQEDRVESELQEESTATEEELADPVERENNTKIESEIDTIPTDPEASDSPETSRDQVEESPETVESTFILSSKISCFIKPERLSQIQKYYGAEELELSASRISELLQAKTQFKIAMQPNISECISFMLLTLGQIDDQRYRNLKVALDSPDCSFQDLLGVIFKDKRLDEFSPIFKNRLDNTWTFALGLMNEQAEPSLTDELSSEEDSSNRVDEEKAKKQGANPQELQNSALESNKLQAEEKDLPKFEMIDIAKLDQEALEDDNLAETLHQEEVQEVLDEEQTVEARESELIIDEADEEEQNLNPEEQEDEQDPENNPNQEASEQDELEEEDSELQDPEHDDPENENPEEQEEADTDPEQEVNETAISELPEENEDLKYQLAQIFVHPQEAGNLVDKQVISRLYNGQLNTMPEKMLTTLIEHSLKSAKIQTSLKEIDVLKSCMVERRLWPLFLMFKFLYRIHNSMNIEEYLKAFTQFIGHYFCREIKFSFKAPIEVGILNISKQYELFSFLVNHLDSVTDANSMNTFEFAVELENNYFEVSRVKLDFHIHCKEEKFSDTTKLILCTEEYIKSL